MKLENIERHKYLMKCALRCARVGMRRHDEVPVGAICVYEDRIISAGYNHPIAAKDPTNHAGVVAIRRAAKRRGAYRIPEVDIYITLEPCTMCMGALIHARVRRLFFAAPDPKVGVISTGVYEQIERGLNHRLEVYGGILAEEAANMLKSFFASKR